MTAQCQFAPTTEAQRDCSSDQSAQSSNPVAPVAAPWYFKALPYVFSKNAVDALSIARKGLLIVGALLLMEATTITTSGFSTKMSWWRVILLGIGYLSYYGVSVAHAILAPAVEVMVMKMKELSEFSKTIPPESLELMKALVLSPPVPNSDGSLMVPPNIDTANLPELTPEMEATVMEVTKDFLENTMLAYKKMRKGDKDPFSHFIPEAPVQKAVIEEILDDEVEVVVPRADDSYEDLGEVEEIVIGRPPSKSGQE